MLTEKDVINALDISPDDIFSHGAVATVDAGISALEALGLKGDIRFAKNLFLTDKRKRYFLCTALHTTAIPFEKELCVRLGLKKGELRAAPASALQEVLGVGPGSVTPFGACQPTADRVILLLDSALRDAPFLVHPLSNECSVRITTAQLDAVLAANGRVGHYVDFSVTGVKVGPDNPPDLRAIAATVPEEKVKGEARGVAAGTDTKKAAKAAKAAKSASQGATESGVIPTVKLDCVATCISSLMQLVNSSVETALEQKGTLTEAQQRQLQSEMEMEVNSLRNASYARGMMATKRAITSRICGEWN